MNPHPERQPLLLDLRGLSNNSNSSINSNGARNREVQELDYTTNHPHHSRNHAPDAPHHHHHTYKPEGYWAKARFAVHRLMHHNSKYSTHFEWLILCVIFVNVTAYILNTLPDLSRGWVDELFNVVELVSVVIFTIEFLLRIWSVSDMKIYRNNRWMGRLKFMLGPMPLIDLASIMPFYIGMFIGGRHSTRFSTALRILRVFRLFKAEKYSRSFSIIGKAVKNEWEVLVAAGFAMLVILIMQATLLYYIMRDHDPHFDSIPSTMWYSALQITGMGGYEPEDITYTPLAKLVAVVTAIISLVVFAVPIGVIADGFIDIFTAKKQERALRGLKAGTIEEVTCPSCGHMFPHQIELTPSLLASPRSSNGGDEEDQ